MASHWYNTGLAEVLDGTIDLVAGANIKIMLVEPTYVPDRDHDFVDEGGANDPVDEELDESGVTGGSGYVAGFGGSGRKVPANRAWQVDKPNDRVEFVFDDPTWAAIKAGEIGWALVIEERTNDADSRLIACLDPADTVTNGGDFTLDVDAAAGALAVSSVAP